VFCREQIVQLRDRHQEILERQADLFLIAPSTAQQAHRATVEFNVPYQMLADPQRLAFAAAGMRRDLFSSLNLRTFQYFLRTWKKGIRQKGIQGNPFQQGGALVIGRGGVLKFHFIGKAAGDHPDLDQVIASIS